MRHQAQNQHGNVIIAVVVLLFLASIVISSALGTTATEARTQAALELRQDRYFESEGSIGRAISWLRENSQSIVSPFRRQEFYTRFDRINPAVGSNDTTIFTVPTQIRLDGTSQSAILTSNNSLATAAFPPTEDITTNTTFPAVSQFQSADTGTSEVRITLVNAIADDPTGDYGPPPAAAPDTDFAPVYRIDAMTDTNRGSHVSAIVETDLAHVFDVGVYGQDYLELNQPCDSYLSNLGTYTVGTRRAKCPVGSNSTSAVHKNNEIYGSLQTNGTILSNPPFGGDTCADFVAGCPNKGETCSGEDCGVPLLEIYDTWVTYCPTGTEQPLITVTGTSGSPQTIVVASSAATDRCFSRIDAAANKVFRLTSTAVPYYVNTLDLHNSATMRIEPDTAGKAVELYVNNIVGNSINGNQAINMTGKPTQFRLIYLGTNDITLNGTAAMAVALVAPNAGVYVTGTFDYYGALLAKRLELNGSGWIHYDESLGGSGPVSDIQFRLREMAQVYR